MMFARNLKIHHVANGLVYFFVVDPTRSNQTVIFGVQYPVSKAEVHSTGNEPVTFQHSYIYTETTGPNIYH